MKISYDSLDEKSWSDDFILQFPFVLWQLASLAVSGKILRLLKGDSIPTTFKKVIASENHHKFLMSKVNLLFFLIPLNQNLKTIHWSTQEFLEVSQHFSALHHERENINISYLQKEFLWRLSLKPSQPYLFCFFLICWSE